MLFFWTIETFYSSNHEKNSTMTIILIINFSWAANQHIRMISDWSCDTEDWSNDEENSALHQKNTFAF